MFRTLVLAGASALVISLAGSGLALANDAQNDRNNHQVWTGAKAEHSQQAMNAMKGGAGTSRNEIKQAQQKLQSEGLYNGQVDGIDGHETQQALKQFQQKNNLQQTGQLDEQTLAKLGVNETTQGSGSSHPPSGMSGNSNSSMQNGNSTPHNK